ncbi:MAG: selenocysteine-specific translation elongation factor [Planctomycetota bacterium]
MSTEQATEQSPQTASYTTVGVIGHIDHGKTSLVGKLTGVETDTHPEEKQRGITIDLGFAALKEEGHTFAFIDAPGHQKYIGNLLAGVSAVDIGLLVVACDQGIQEQTLEHVSILSTLQVPRMVVALSRVDLCEAERIAEVSEELEVFLSDFGFQDFPVVPTSVVSGEGLERLRQELKSAAESRAAAAAEEQRLRRSQPFRMPIDRVLNVTGRGLVLAGTPWTGGIEIGDQLQLAGRESSLRVREIEIHGDMVETSRCGVRTAINLAGHDGSSISRGDELIAVDAFPLAKRFLVALEVYDEAKEIKLPTTTQMHSATGAVEARLLGPKMLQPGQSALALVESEEPVLGTYGQAVLMRHPYPVGSFAGGRILGVCNFDLKELGRTKKQLIELAPQLQSADALERVAAWIAFHGELRIDEKWLHWQIGADLNIEEVHTYLSSRDDIQSLGQSFVSLALVARVENFLKAFLSKHSEEQEDQWVLIDSLVRRAGHLASPQVSKLAIQRLLRPADGAEPSVVELNGMLAIASEKTKLSKKQKAKMELMLRLFADNRKPPTVKELCEELAITKDAVNSLTRHATQQKVLLDLGQGFFFSAEMFRTLCGELSQLFEENAELAVPQVKDAWGVTRKHVIPLLEYCDQQQITQRNQDGRVAGSRLAEYSE